MPGGRFEVPDSSDNDPFSEKSKKLLHDSHKEPKTGKQNILGMNCHILK